MAADDNDDVTVDDDNNAAHNADCVTGVPADVTLRPLSLSTLSALTTLLLTVTLLCPVSDAEGATAVFMGGLSLVDLVFTACTGTRAGMGGLRVGMSVTEPGRISDEFVTFSSLTPAKVNTLY